MFLFWSGFSDLLSVVVVDLEGSDALFEVSGGSLVTVTSRLFGNDGMVTVLGIVNLKNV